MEFYVVYDAAVPSWRWMQTSSGTRDHVSGHHAYPLRADPPPHSSTFTVVCLDQRSCVHGTDTLWLSKPDVMRGQRNARRAMFKMNARMAEAVQDAVHAIAEQHHCSEYLVPEYMDEDCTLAEERAADAVPPVVCVVSTLNCS